MGEVLEPFWSSGAPGNEKDTKKVENGRVTTPPRDLVGRRVSDFFSILWVSFLVVFLSVVLEAFGSNFKWIWEGF